MEQFDFVEPDWIGQSKEEDCNLFRGIYGKVRQGKRPE